MSAFDLGKYSMLDVINNQQGIGLHINDIAENPQMLAGAVTALLSVYKQIHAMGVVAKHDVAEIDAFLQSGGNTMAAKLTIKLATYDRPWLNKHIDAMVKAVAAHRIGWKFHLDPAPNAQAPAPLEMKIVSMPERVTESAITYDQKGDIKSTTQTEKDVIVAVIPAC